MQIERLYPPGHRAWWEQQAMRRKPQQPNNQKHVPASVELVEFTCEWCGVAFTLSYTQAANRASTPRFHNRHCNAKHAASCTRGRKK